jgi:hypothetical protein
MYFQANSKIKPNFLKTNQELLISFGVALLCLFLSFIFPTKNYAETITKNLFFLVILPIAYIKIILKKRLTDFGWNLENPKIALGWGIGTFFFTLLLFYLLINFTDFQSSYALESYIKNNFWLFLAYELIVVNFSLFIINCFFQGFVFSIFREKFGYLAIIISTGIFFLTIFFSESITLKIVPLLLLFITASFLAHKTKSFFYSYFMSIFAIIILDAYIIYLTR